MRAAFVWLFALAACSVATTPKTPAEGAAPTIDRQGLLAIYDEAGLPSVVGLERVRVTQATLGPDRAPIFGDAWVLSSRPERRLWLDTLEQVAAPATLEEALAAERAARARVPPALRAPFVGQLPTLARVEVIDFGAALRRELEDVEALVEGTDEWLDHRDRTRFTGGAPVYWLVRARWAFARGHPALASRALAQVVRMTSRVCESGCTSAQVIRDGLQEVLIREAYEAIRVRAPWDAARRLAHRAAALAPAGRHVDEARALLTRIDALAAAERSPPGRGDDALDDDDAVISLLREETCKRWQPRWVEVPRFAWSPFWELVGRGDAAVPALLERLEDTTPARCGETVGALALYAVALIAMGEASLSSGSAEEQRARARAWWRARASKPPPRVSRSRDSLPTAPAPSLPTTWGRAAPRPSFVTLAFDGAALSAQAQPRRAGALHPTARGPAWPRSRRRPGTREPDEEPSARPVLDPGTRGDPARRVQLLCEEPGHRLAIFRSARDLRTTLRASASLVARPGQAIEETTPRLRLPAGVDGVTFGARRGASVAARYRDEELRARGWIDVALVDVVWDETPTAEIDESAFDGQLIGTSVPVRERPRGAAFAWFSGEIPARALARQGDALLVHARVEPGELVGWVAARAFVVGPPSTGLIGKGGGGGMGTWGGGPWTILERGDLLVDEASEQVVGVVTWDSSFECDGPCVEPTPRVWVDACGDSLAVRAVRLSTSPRAPAAPRVAY